MDGGIWGLLGLIRSHRGAVEYDLRHRFQLSLRDVGQTISLSEVARLVTILQADPSSAIASKLAGWDYPISREALAILDLYDLTMRANADPKKKVEPHSGRPFDMSSKTTRKMGDTGGRTRAEVVEILNSLGHNLPV